MKILWGSLGGVHQEIKTRQLYGKPTSDEVFFLIIHLKEDGDMLNF